MRILWYVPIAEMDDDEEEEEVCIFDGVEPPGFNLNVMILKGIRRNVK